MKKYLKITLLVFLVQITNAEILTLVNTQIDKNITTSNSDNDINSSVPKIIEKEKINVSINTDNTLEVINKEIEYKILFDKSVTDFNLSDISLGGGVGILNEIKKNEYILNVTPNENSKESLSIQVKANSIKNIDGYVNDSSNLVKQKVDTLGPIVVLSIKEVKDDYFIINIDIDELGKQTISLDNFDIKNASGELLLKDKIYTLKITPNQNLDGNVEVFFKEDVLSDSLSNKNQKSNTIIKKYNNMVDENDISKLSTVDLSITDKVNERINVQDKSFDVKYIEFLYPQSVNSIKEMVLNAEKDNVEEVKIEGMGSSSRYLKKYIDTIYEIFPLFKDPYYSNKLTLKILTPNVKSFCKNDLYSEALENKLSNLKSEEITDDIELTTEELNDFYGKSKYKEIEKRYNDFIKIKDKIDNSIELTTNEQLYIDNYKTEINDKLILDKYITDEDYINFEKEQWEKSCEVNIRLDYDIMSKLISEKINNFLNISYDYLNTELKEISKDEKKTKFELINTLDTNEEESKFSRIKLLIDRSGFKNLPCLLILDSDKDLAEKYDIELENRNEIAKEIGATLPTECSLTTDGLFTNKSADIDSNLNRIVDNLDKDEEEITKENDNRYTEEANKTNIIEGHEVKVTHNILDGIKFRDNDKSADTKKRLLEFAIGLGYRNIPMTLLPGFYSKPSFKRNTNMIFNNQYGAKSNGLQLGGNFKSMSKEDIFKELMKDDKFLSKIYQSRQDIYVSTIFEGDETINVLNEPIIKMLNNKNYKIYVLDATLGGAHGKVMNVKILGDIITHRGNHYAPIIPKSLEPYTKRISNRFLGTYEDLYKSGFHTKNQKCTKEKCEIAISYKFEYSGSGRLNISTLLSTGQIRSNRSGTVKGTQPANTKVYYDLDDFAILWSPLLNKQESENPYEFYGSKMVLEDKYIKNWNQNHQIINNSTEKITGLEVFDRILLYIYKYNEMIDLAKANKLTPSHLRWRFDYNAQYRWNNGRKVIDKVISHKDLNAETRVSSELCKLWSSFKYANNKYLADLRNKARFNDLYNTELMFITNGYSLNELPKFDIKTQVYKYKIGIVNYTNILTNSDVNDNLCADNEFSYKIIDKYFCFPKSKIKEEIVKNTLNEYSLGRLYNITHKTLPWVYVFPKYDDDNIQISSGYLTIGDELNIEYDDYNTKFENNIDGIDGKTYNNKDAILKLMGCEDISIKELTKKDKEWAKGTVSCLNSESNNYNILKKERTVNTKDEDINKQRVKIDLIKYIDNPKINECIKSVRDNKLQTLKIEKIKDSFSNQLYVSLKNSDLNSAIPIYIKETQKTDYLKEKRLERLLEKLEKDLTISNNNTSLKDLTTTEGFLYGKSLFLEKINFEFPKIAQSNIQINIPSSFYNDSNSNMLNILNYIKGLNSSSQADLDDYLFSPIQKSLILEKSTFDKIENKIKYTYKLPSNKKIIECNDDENKDLCIKNEIIPNICQPYYTIIKNKDQSINNFLIIDNTEVDKNDINGIEQNMLKRIGYNDSEISSILNDLKLISESGSKDYKNVSVNCSKLKNNIYSIEELPKRNQDDKRRRFEIDNDQNIKYEINDPKNNKFIQELLNCGKIIYINNSTNDQIPYSGAGHKLMCYGEENDNSFASNKIKIVDVDSFSNPNSNIINKYVYDFGNDENRYINVFEIKNEIGNEDEIIKKTINHKPVYRITTGNNSLNSLLSSIDYNVIDKEELNIEELLNKEVNVGEEVVIRTLSIKDEENQFNNKDSNTNIIKKEITLVEDENFILKEYIIIVPTNKLLSKNNLNINGDFLISDRRSFYNFKKDDSLKKIVSKIIVDEKTEENKINLALFIKNNEDILLNNEKDKYIVKILSRKDSKIEDVDNNIIESNKIIYKENGYELKEYVFKKDIYDYSKFKLKIGEEIKTINDIDIEKDEKDGSIKILNFDNTKNIYKYSLDNGDTWIDVDNDIVNIEDKEYDYDLFLLKKIKRSIFSINDLEIINKNEEGNIEILNFDNTKNIYKYSLDNGDTWIDIDNDIIKIEDKEYDYDLLKLEIFRENNEYTLEDNKLLEKTIDGNIKILKIEDETNYKYSIDNGVNWLSVDLDSDEILLPIKELYPSEYNLKISGFNQVSKELAFFKQTNVDGQMFILNNEYNVYFKDFVEEFNDLIKSNMKNYIKLDIKSLGNKRYNEKLLENEGSVVNDININQYFSYDISDYHDEISKNIDNIETMCLKLNNVEMEDYEKIIKYLDKYNELLNYISDVVPQNEQNKLKAEKLFIEAQNDLVPNRINDKGEYLILVPETKTTDENGNEVIIKEHYEVDENRGISPLFTNLETETNNNMSYMERTAKAAGFKRLDVQRKDNSKAGGYNNIYIRKNEQSFVTWSAKKKIKVSFHGIKVYWSPAKNVGNTPDLLNIKLNAKNLIKFLKDKNKTDGHDFSILFKDETIGSVYFKGIKEEDFKDVKLDAIMDGAYGKLYGCEYSDIIKWNRECKIGIKSFERIFAPVIKAFFKQRSKLVKQIMGLYDTKIIKECTNSLQSSGKYKYPLNFLNINELSKYQKEDNILIENQGTGLELNIIEEELKKVSGYEKKIYKLEQKGSLLEKDAITYCSNLLPDKVSTGDSVFDNNNFFNNYYGIKKNNQDVIVETYRKLKSNYDRYITYRMPKVFPYLLNRKKYTTSYGWPTLLKQYGVNFTTYNNNYKKSIHKFVCSDNTGGDHDGCYFQKYTKSDIPLNTVLKDYFYIVKDGNYKISSSVDYSGYIIVDDDQKKSTPIEKFRNTTKKTISLKKGKHFVKVIAFVDDRKIVRGLSGKITDMNNNIIWNTLNGQKNYFEYELKIKEDKRVPNTTKFAYRTINVKNERNYIEYNGNKNKYQEIACKRYVSLDNYCVYKKTCEGGENDLLYINEDGIAVCKSTNHPKVKKGIEAQPITHPKHITPQCNIKTNFGWFVEIFQPSKIQKSIRKDFEKVIIEKRIGCPKGEEVIGRFQVDQMSVNPVYINNKGLITIFDTFDLYNMVVNKDTGIKKTLSSIEEIAKNIMNVSSDAMENFTQGTEIDKIVDSCNDFKSKWVYEMPKTSQLLENISPFKRYVNANKEFQYQYTNKDGEKIERSVDYCDEIYDLSTENLYDENSIYNHNQESIEYKTKMVDMAKNINTYLYKDYKDEAEDIDLSVDAGKDGNYCGAKNDDKRKYEVALEKYKTTGVYTKDLELKKQCAAKIRMIKKTKQDKIDMMEKLNAVLTAENETTTIIDDGGNITEILSTNHSEATTKVVDVNQISAVEDIEITKIIDKIRDGNSKEKEIMGTQNIFSDDIVNASNIDYDYDDMMGKFDEDAIEKSRKYKEKIKGIVNVIGTMTGSFGVAMIVDVVLTASDVSEEMIMSKRKAKNQVDNNDYKSEYERNKNNFELYNGKQYKELNTGLSSNSLKIADTAKKLRNELDNNIKSYGEYIETNNKEANKAFGTNSSLFLDTTDLSSSSVDIKLKEEWKKNREDYKENVLNNADLDNSDKLNDYFNISTTDGEDLGDLNEEKIVEAIKGVNNKVKNVDSNIRRDLQSINSTKLGQAASSFENENEKDGLSNTTGIENEYDIGEKMGENYNIEDLNNNENGFDANLIDNTSFDEIINDMNRDLN